MTEVKIENFCLLAYGHGHYKPTQQIERKATK
jgi:hypothetical protein